MTVTRGTTNRNNRGSSENRRRRREWLVETYRADVDLLLTPLGTVYGTVTVSAEHESWAATATRHAACRCYRCGHLLTVDTVTVDRIIPGCLGGTYRRDNIRPACGTCNSSTGGQLAHRERKRATA
jgi:5-methylcytosine-specific restriction endonuclease McrA